MTGEEPIIESVHLQQSPDEEICQCCIVVGNLRLIPAFNYYYIVFLTDGTQFDCCLEHFATLQPIPHD